MIFENKSPDAIKPADGGARLCHNGDPVKPIDAAFDVHPCLEKQAYEMLVQAIKSKDYAQLVDCLKSMGENNLCLIGSRGYVYDMGVVAGWLLTVPYGRFVPLQAIPRTLGLRKACEVVWKTNQPLAKG